MNKGVLSAATAYVAWGFFPIYFHAINAVPALQTVSHRIVWCLLFLVAVLIVRGEWQSFRSVLTRRNLLIYLGAGVLLAINWLTYIYGVNAGFVIETSLGYFINPLVSVVLGMIFLREKLRPWQWAPVGLAAAGVIYLTLEYGSLPWIALLLAFSFGFYGLVKKVAPLGSLQGLSMETLMIFIPAAAFLLFSEASGTGQFGHTTAWTSLMLVLAGPLTALPLLLFATGARRVPLTTMGLLQYISPTIQFMLGVFLFGEAFTPDRLVGFGLIWLALIVFSVEGFLTARRASPVQVIA